MASEELIHEALSLFCQLTLEEMKETIDFAQSLKDKAAQDQEEVFRMNDSFSTELSELMELINSASQLSKSEMKDVMKYIEFLMFLREQ